MPKIFEVYGYSIYFWTNEGHPLEPIHVHISKRAEPNATKVWITRSGGCLLCMNSSQIPSHLLRNIMRVVEEMSGEIIEEWVKCFGEIRYFC